MERSGATGPGSRSSLLRDQLVAVSTSSRWRRSDAAAVGVRRIEDRSLKTGDQLLDLGCRHRNAMQLESIAADVQMRVSRGNTA